MNDYVGFVRKECRFQFTRLVNSIFIFFIKIIFIYNYVCLKSPNYLFSSQFLFSTSLVVFNNIIGNHVLRQNAFKRNKNYCNKVIYNNNLEKWNFTVENH